MKGPCVTRTTHQKTTALHPRGHHFGEPVPALRPGQPPLQGGHPLRGSCSFLRGDLTPQGWRADGPRAHSPPGLSGPKGDSAAPRQCALGPSGPQPPGPGSPRPVRPPPRPFGHPGPALPQPPPQPLSPRHLGPSDLSGAPPPGPAPPPRPLSLPALRQRPAPRHPPKVRRCLKVFSDGMARQAGRGRRGAESRRPQAVAETAPTVATATALVFSQPAAASGDRRGVPGGGARSGPPPPPWRAWRKQGERSARGGVGAGGSGGGRRPAWGVRAPNQAVTRGNAPRRHARCCPRGRAAATRPRSCSRCRV